MFDTILKFLKLGLALLKADPADKEAIAALQAEVATLKTELAASQSNDPTPEQQAEIDAVLAEFEAATPPEQDIPEGAFGSDEDDEPEAIQPPVE